MAKAATVVRCCPRLFRRRHPGDAAAPRQVHTSSADGRLPWLPLPYRAVFAVGTLDGVLLYDTEQPYPVATIAHVHYAQITDLAWYAGVLLVKRFPARAATDCSPAAQVYGWELAGSNVIGWLLHVRELRGGRAGRAPATGG